MTEKMSLEGVKPGGPVDREKMWTGWVETYLAISLIRSHNPEEHAKLNRIKNLLAEANELITEILG